jgi:hypothetical protein
MCTNLGTNVAEYMHVIMPMDSRHARNESTGSLSGLMISAAYSELIVESVAGIGCEDANATESRVPVLPPACRKGRKPDSLVPFVGRI